MLCVQIVRRDYDESKLTKTLWPTFTCSAEWTSYGQLTSILRKMLGTTLKQKAADAAAVWVKSEDIDWC